MPASSTSQNPPSARRTKAEMAHFRDAIYELVERNQPCNVRHVYYSGIAVLWAKDTGATKRRNYKMVCRELGKLREDEVLPWGWITDSSRSVRIDTMYEDIEDAFARWQESYRRNLWASQPRRVEVWCESDSIAGVLDPITRPYGIGLFPCKGQAPKTFAYNAAVAYKTIGKPVTILYVGDWDPSGLAIARSLEERLRRYSKDLVDIEFVRVAITPDDVRQGDLVSHDLNKNDVNYAKFLAHCRLEGLVPQAVEVEALPAPILRERLKQALLDLVDDPEMWNSTLAAEESEKTILGDIRKLISGEVA